MVFVFIVSHPGDNPYPSIKRHPWQEERLRVKSLICYPISNVAIPFRISTSDLSTSLQFKGLYIYLPYKIYPPHNVYARAPTLTYNWIETKTDLLLWASSSVLNTNHKNSNIHILGYSLFLLLLNIIESFNILGKVLSGIK